MNSKILKAFGLSLALLSAVPVVGIPGVGSVAKADGPFERSAGLINVQIQVVNSRGQHGPLQNVRVSVFRANGSLVGTAVTDRNGIVCGALKPFEVYTVRMQYGSSTLNVAYMPAFNPHVLLTMR